MFYLDFFYYFLKVKPLLAPVSPFNPPPPFKGKCFVFLVKSGELFSVLNQLIWIIFRGAMGSITGVGPVK